LEKHVIKLHFPETSEPFENKWLVFYMGPYVKIIFFSPKLKT
jgi:hypothetical protein